MPDTIEKYTVVSLHLTMSDSAGNILDSTRGSQPLVYIHGTDSLLAGLEEQLAGRHVGEKVQISLPPEKAFGLIDPALTQTVPISLFEDMDIKEGMVLGSQSDSHQLRTVTKIDGDQVVLDANHPMAGKALHFDVEILFIRSATSAEIENGLDAVVTSNSMEKQSSIR